MLVPYDSPALREEVHRYATNALSDNTRKAYATDLAQFIAWGGTIPCTAECVATYLTAHAATLSMATLQRRLVSIAKAHTLQDYPNPVSHALVQLTLRGIRRVHGAPQRQVSALVKEDLLLMLAQIPDTRKGMRDRALLLLGFCAALRRSELAAVRVKDIEFTTQGLVLTILRSKTDQNGEGCRIAIPRGRGRICPVESIHVWFLHSVVNTAYSVLFPSISKGGVVSDTPLSDRAIADIIKYYAAKAGLDASQYSGHSLRAGLATSAAQHGISSWVIRKQTRHSSDAMLTRYIREADLFTHNAAGIF